MWFVKQPEYYDVNVTENLFGDIFCSWLWGARDTMGGGARSNL
jgi:isocitrate/isopropylmalate dehydrogenase